MGVWNHAKLSAFKMKESSKGRLKVSQSQYNICLQGCEEQPGISCEELLKNMCDINQPPKLIREAWWDATILFSDWS